MPGSRVPGPPPRTRVGSGGSQLETFIFLWFLKDFEGKPSFSLGFSSFRLPGIHFPYIFLQFCFFGSLRVRDRVHSTKFSVPTSLRKRFRYLNGMESATWAGTEGIHWFSMTPQPYAVFPCFLQHLGLEMKAITQKFSVSAPASSAWERLLLSQCRSQHLSAELRHHFHHLISLRCTELNGNQPQTQLTFLMLNLRQTSGGKFRRFFFSRDRRFLMHKTSVTCEKKKIWKK